jgi:hypothetical protein
LTLAAQEADIIGFSGITFRRGGTAPDLSAWKAAGVDERVQLVRAVSGDRFASLELNVLIQRVVVDDRRRAAEELARDRPQLTPEEFLDSPFVLLGTIDQMAEDLLARRQRWGFSYFTIHEPYLSAFAPVVGQLRGR